MKSTQLPIKLFFTLLTVCTLALSSTALPVQAQATSRPTLCIPPRFHSRATPTAPGQITEYPVPIPNGYAWGITSGPDGNLWVTQYPPCMSTQAYIVQMTPDGAFIAAFPIPTQNALPEEITTGPDGNLWFTDYGANQIGKVTTYSKTGAE